MARWAGLGTSSVTVFRKFAAGLFEGWTRLPVSDRCRAVIVALSVPCAVAVTLAVRPASPQPGSLFLDLEDSETAAGEVLDPWGVPLSFEDGGYTDVVPAALRAEVIVE